MSYLVIERPPVYPCDALITYLTAELGAVLTTGAFGDAPNSQGLYDLLSHSPAFEAYEPAVHLVAQLERHLRLKRIWQPDRQWLIGTESLIGAMLSIPVHSPVWETNERDKTIKEGMQFILRTHVDILSDFDCLMVPDLTVCVRSDDPEHARLLGMVKDIWTDMFPDSPVIVVDPEVSYTFILEQLGE